MDYPSLQVKVWGDLACFTRPEMKVERVSYEVITPSAARGVLEAIFWKPEFLWEVRAIKVLRPIRHFSILRNELKNKTSVRAAQSWAEKNGGYLAEDDRAQRHTLALRDVAYVIVADVYVLPDVEQDPAKYRDQFRRRLAHGQCHTMPYLGCREFTASFSEVDDNEEPVQVTAELGRMLFDLDYRDDESGRGQPRFYAARLDEGVMAIPPELYEQRRRLHSAPRKP